jgi:hypothetical protein
MRCNQLLLEVWTGRISWCKTHAIKTGLHYVFHQRQSTLWPACKDCKHSNSPERPFRHSEILCRTGCKWPKLFFIALLQWIQSGFGTVHEILDDAWNSPECKPDIIYYGIYTFIHNSYNLATKYSGNTNLSYKFKQFMSNKPLHQC